MLATLSAMCDEPCEDQYICRHAVSGMKEEYTFWAKVCIWPGIREYGVIATEPTVLQIQGNFKNYFLTNSIPF